MSEAAFRKRDIAAGRALGWARENIDTITGLIAGTLVAVPVAELERLRAAADRQDDLTEEHRYD